MVISFNEIKEKIKDKQLIQDLDEKLLEAENARMPLEKQWLINLSFYLGEQWVIWNPVTKSLERPTVPEWRVLTTVNYIRPIVRTELAKLMKQKPIIGVQPTGNEPDRVNQAKAAEKIRQYLWDKTNMDEIRKQVLLWALVTGTGIFKVYYDPTAGEVIDEEGTRLGEVVLSAVSPFEFYPDPYATTIDEMNWCFHVKIRSAEYVAEKYGVEVEPEAINVNQYLEGKMFLITDNTSQNIKKGVVVKEFWQRPTKKYPRGRYVVYVKDKVLFAGDNPYEQGMLPFAAFSHIPVPGRFWGDSVVTDLIKPQMNYNKARSQAIEIRNLMSKPKWLVPKGSLETQITSAPGENIEYVPVANLRPEPIRGIDVPATFWKEFDQIKSEFYDVSGQHEVSHAQIPAGIRSGIAIAYLQEQDDTRLTVTAQSYEKALEKVETLKLRLARQFYIEPRVGRIVGENNTVEVFTFMGRDIPEDVDVKVQAGSSLPQSRVAKQEFIISLWEQKIIQDPKVVLKLLEFGDVEGIYDDIDLDTSQAQRENELMKEGKYEEPEDFENHEVHIYEHNKFRKTEEYDALPDEIKQLFAQHVAVHQSFLQQQGGMMSQLQQLLQQPSGGMTPSLTNILGGAGGGQTETGYGSEIPGISETSAQEGGI
jgi:hypothetical protein